MAPHIYYLSEAENTLVNLKAQGFNTHHILANCPIPLIGFHMFTADVKRKTGIHGRDYIEFADFLKNYTAAMSGELTTPEQTRAMRYVISGSTRTNFLGLSREEIHSMVDAGCQAAGIFTRDERARRFAMRLYLAIFRSNAKPLDQLETKILRELAEGKTFEEINEYCPAQRVQFVIGKARAACLRLHFDAPGRNAQRNLLRAYFACLDRQAASATPTIPAQPADPSAPITMGDPMF